MIINTAQKQLRRAAVQESYYNLAKFTGKHICRSLSFNKFAVPWPATLF